MAGIVRVELSVVYPAMPAHSSYHYVTGIHLLSALDDCTESIETHAQVVIDGIEIQSQNNDGVINGMEMHYRKLHVVIGIAIGGFLLLASVVTVIAKYVSKCSI